MYLILKTYLQCAAYSGKLNWYFLNSAVTWTRRFLIFLIKVLAKNYAYEGTNIITGLFRRLTQASPLPFSTFFLFNLLMHALQVFCIAIVHRRHEEYSVPLCCGKKKEKRGDRVPILEGTLHWGYAETGEKRQLRKMRTKYLTIHTLVQKVWKVEIFTSGGPRSSWAAAVRRQSVPLTWLWASSS